MIGFPADSRGFHNRLWPRLREKGFARRRAYDMRAGLALLENGVTEFATVNVKNFQGIGFGRVWNPLSFYGISSKTIAIENGRHQARRRQPGSANLLTRRAGTKGIH